MNDATPTDTIKLHLQGAKPKVEIQRALGILPRVMVNGERHRPAKGGWMIPVAGGEEKLAMRGVVPGFQRFEWRGKVVAQLGDHVGRAERLAMFAPAFLLAGVWSVFTVPIALALFFMNIPVVKNPTMPRGLRVALPIINTLAAGVALIAALALLGSQA